MKKLTENRKLIGLLLLIVGVASVPLMTDYVIGGSSLATSLSQIRVMSRGLGKVFPLRTGTLANMDYGYSAASFQANLFFIIPAVLHALGMQIGVAYKLTLFVCNLATVTISYTCFERVFKKQELGLIGSMLYTWNFYRLSEMYLVGDLGEIIAWIFLPIVFLGISRLYANSTDEKSGTDAWVILTLGFSLMIVSSTVLMFVAAVICALFVLFMGKRALKKSVLVCLAKTCVATGLVNAWFLIPMLLRMRDVSAVAPLLVKDVQGMGMHVMQYFITFAGAGGGVGLAEDGVQNAQAMSPGIAVVLLFILALWFVFVGMCSKSQGTDCGWLLKRSILVSVVLVWFSTNLFPWDLFQNRNMLFSVVLAIMYTPAKLGIGAGSVMLFTALLLLDSLSSQLKEQMYKGLLLLVTAVSFGSSQYLLGQILFTRGFARAEEVEAMSNIAFPLIAEESMIWRASELISVLAVCGLIGVWIVRRHKCVKRV